MVKVKMKTTAAGPQGGCLKGHIWTVADEYAAELVKKGYAEYVKEPEKIELAVKERQEEIEMAVEKDDTEKAIKYKFKKK